MTHTPVPADRTDSTKAMEKFRLVDRKPHQLKYSRNKKDNVSLLDKVSVDTMAFCGIRNHFDRVGIKGYNVPKLSTKLKPQAHKIPDCKKYGGMLDHEMRSHGDNPSPSHYDIIVNMAHDLKTNPITDKKPRQTYLGEIAAKSRREKVPGVGTYDIQTKSRKPLGNIL